LSSSPIRDLGAFSTITCKIRLKRNKRIRRQQQITTTAGTTTTIKAAAAGE